MNPGERCDECLFVYDLALSARAPERIEAMAEAFAPLLEESGSDVARRPAPETWSPLEYACHVRDVLLVQRERVLLARRSERPSFEPMGRDERAEHDGYAEQDPSDVVRQLLDAGRLFAGVLRRLAPDDWDRSVVYSYPRPQERSLRWVAVHTVHELQHHTNDVRRQLG